MSEVEVMNEKLMLDVLSVPSYTGQEHRMMEFLVAHAAEKGYQCETDSKGNVYLRKGKVAEGSFYPCLTAHMDTVQSSQIPYIQKGEPLPLIMEEREGQHVVYTEGFGLGGDDKAGIAVALSIMERVPVCKAAFFVEEETGCHGSMEANLAWFKDVGYVIAFDAPGWNCASWACSGIALFGKDFYETYLEELRTNFGLTNFHYHPYTDVTALRLRTNLVCMNFGAGYHHYHTSREYCVIEEMQQSVNTGIYLIDRLGQKKYVAPKVPDTRISETEDHKYFRTRFRQCQTYALPLQRQNHNTTI